MMNANQPFGLFRLRASRMPAWQIAVIGAIAAAIVVTLAIVATGVFLVVFPALLVLDAVYRWRARKSARAPRSASETIIDAEYEVLPPEDRNRR
ncbi:hypothetical protein [Flaviflagellibacter deserti]|uniref:Integral membrane protein n=1 Tax=Flaviflagellibacter deserti TaxID=2267266 RepID=A0ABV9Z412_9HYPH